MKETIDKVLNYFKTNPLLAVGAVLAAVLLFFPKLLKFGSRTRRRRSYRPVTPYRRKTVRRSYTRGGKQKKPWQIKGSLAAKRHMAQIRKRR